MPWSMSDIQNGVGHHIEVKTPHTYKLFKRHRRTLYILAAFWLLQMIIFLWVVAAK